MLFLSRIHPKKGVRELVEAWSRVRPDNWKLVIAGPEEGGYGELIAAEIQRAGLSDSVSMVGAVYGDDKKHLFASADLFILPTYSENFGLVVAEALSYGVPVITTKGAPWECLVETNSGWWIDTGVESLTHAIASATSKSAFELKAMGARGLLMVKSRFSWDAASQSLLEVYNWLLGVDSRPASVIID